MFNKMTIKDIAELAGVSTATVSYYLNGNYKKMSEKTRNRIRKIIEATGYEPSVIAKGLATKDLKTIGVVIADITNPFIASVMKGVSDVCKEMGYTVSFTNSDNDLQLEVEGLSHLKQQGVSGIILDSVAADNPVINTLDNKTTVMLDRQSKNLMVDTVVADNESSTYQFIRKMKAKGYDKIYFVTFPLSDISTRLSRYAGFKRGLNIDHDDFLIEINDTNFQKTISRILESKKKERVGFFTVNGPALLKFMRVVTETSYKFPADFGVGSYEDLEWMNILNPQVSCIRQNSYQMGKIAASHLIAKLTEKEPAAKARLITIPNELVIRESF